MAYILIDGYNLLGIAHHNLEMARNNLIQQLCRYADLKGHHITVVFDGYKSGQMDETERRLGNVNVIFSRLGEKADLVIKRILSQSSRHWIAVSSDREIKDFAWKNGFICLTTMEFENRLRRALKQEKAEDSVELIDTKYLEDDIDIIPPRQKGNPKMPSKRQRQKLRALNKL